MIQFPSNKLTQYQTDYNHNFLAGIGHSIIIYNLIYLTRILGPNLYIINHLLRLTTVLYGSIIAFQITKVLTIDTWLLSHIIYNSNFSFFPPVYQNLTLFTLCVCCLFVSCLLNAMFFLGLGFMIGDKWTTYGFVNMVSHVGKTFVKCVKCVVEGA